MSTLAKTTRNLPDGSSVELTAGQDAHYKELCFGGKDGQAMLLNFQKYGKFMPSKEDFDAYRERRDNMVTSGRVEDATTGLAGEPVAKLFNRLHTDVKTVFEAHGAPFGKVELLLEELRRRLAAAPSQMQVTLEKLGVERDNAIREAREACDARDAARALENEHLRRAQEVVLREAELVKTIASLEHRIESLKELLPDEVKAGGRALSL